MSERGGWGCVGLTAIGLGFVLSFLRGGFAQVTD